MKKLAWIIAFTLFSCFSLSSLTAYGSAAASGGDKKAETKADEDAGSERYIALDPTFVVNYGTDPTGPLKYLKTDIAIRAEDAESANIVRAHTVLIRNELVILLSEQEEKNLITPEGKEALRQEALAAVNRVLEQEEGKPYAQDLLFVSFIVQQ